MNAYNRIDEQGQERPHPWPGLGMAALGDGTAQTVTSSGNLTYVISTMYFDSDNFSTNFDIKRQGLYHAEANIKLTWAVVPTTGTVLAQIKDAGAIVVAEWKQYVIGLDDVRLYLGGLHTVDRDSFFEIYIQNDTDQDLDATCKMGVSGVVVPS